MDKAAAQKFVDDVNGAIARMSWWHLNPGHTAVFQADSVMVIYSQSAEPLLYKVLETLAKPKELFGELIGVVVRRLLDYARDHGGFHEDGSGNDFVTVVPVICWSDAQGQEIPNLRVAGVLQRHLFDRRRLTMRVCTESEAQELVALGAFGDEILLH